MRTVRIAILGPPLSGKHTSLRQFLKLSRPPRVGPPPTSADWRASAAWVSTGEEWQITFTMKSRCNVIAFPDVQAALADPLARQELMALSEAEGIIFVVDSQRLRLPANLWYLEQVARELEYFGRQPSSVPLVFQLNKQDCPDIMDTAELTGHLSWPVCDYVETVASAGEGLEAVVNRILALLKARL
jgi:hypothetical protein